MPNTCKENDYCHPKGVGSDGNTCPGYCPEDCEATDAKASDAEAAEVVNADTEALDTDATDAAARSSWSDVATAA